MVRLTRRTRIAGEPTCSSHIDKRQREQYQAFRAELIGRKGERAVAAALERLGRPALHDIILPDEMGLTQIDHLVLGDDALLVLETKSYGGVITGKPVDAEWFQHLNDGAVRTPFMNPLRQNFRHCQAVEQLLQLAGSRLTVVGHIVSAGRATFAAELRDSVVELAALDALFTRQPGRLTAGVEMHRVWKHIAGVAAQYAEQREAHRAGLAGARRD